MGVRFPPSVAPTNRPKYRRFGLISIPPAVGMLLAAIPTWHYALPDDEHTRILNELNEKRNAAAAEAAE